MAQADQVERFHPTSGRVLGTIGLLLCAAVVGVGLLDREHGFSAPVVTGALVVAVLVWGSMLKPRAMVVGRHLVLRGMFETTRIPLAAIEDVVVRQVLAVRAGDKRYVSPAVGRSLRQSLRAGSRPTGDGTFSVSAGEAVATASYADIVEERIRRLAQQAAVAEGVRRYSDEQVALAAQVERTPAWLEIGLLVATLAAFVVTLAL